MKLKSNLKNNWKTVLLHHSQITRISRKLLNKIIIEADTNVGYVCLYKTDLLDQYTKINVQQNFGAVKISEEWYLVNIMKFIKDAEENLPTELSKIVLKKDFIWNETTSEIGVLTLQPKVLKLKAINYENINFTPLPY